jgi:16S rRNA (uracil1498-N3)-methyltransferase
MSTLRVPMSELESGERDLDEEQIRYVVRVHRLRAGDRFVAFDPKRGIECDAELVSKTRALLGEARASSAATTRAITWIHACPKGDKADAIVRDATELGAARIVFVYTARIVAKPPISRVARWERIAREAARQSGRADAPDVSLETKWEDALANASADVRVCLDPRGAPLNDVLARARGSLAFAAGPEGGLTDGEIEIAKRHGFATCRLGAFVMRTETVPAAVLGAVALAIPQ